MSSNVYSKKSNNVRNLLRFVDSFYMKFLVVLISLIFPAGITMTKVFGVEKFSKVGVFIFIIAATFLTLLWTKLDFKVTPSLFSSHMPWSVKKNALARRGILLFIMMQLLEEIPIESMAQSGFFKFIFLNISKLYLRVGIIVMLIAGILILFRPTSRKNY